MKKLLSFMVALVLSLNLCCEVFAYGYDQDYSMQYPQFNSDYKISGTNAFGSMMAEAINNELNEQQENNGFNVFSVEITAGIATVELETLRDSTVVVGIYDETGSTLLMTGSSNVTSDDEYVSVVFPKELPQYFYIRAYLIDIESMRPLCTVYECPNYTREMQEFFSKTVYDFDQDKVLNLDEDISNNFAVYSEIVTVVPCIEGINTLLSQGGGMYVFANADINIRGLQPEQIFSYEYAPGEIIIAKVATVTDNGDGTVTVFEQDTDLEEAFKYIKIDTSAGLEKAEIDNSELEDGVEFVGVVDENPDPYGIRTMDNAENGSIEHGNKDSLKYHLFKNETNLGKEDQVLSGKFTVEGDVTLSLESKVKYYISTDISYIEVSLDVSLGLDFSIEGEAKLRFPLSEFIIKPIPYLTFELTPKFAVEFKAKLKVESKISGSLGYRADTKVGVTDISKPFELSKEVDLDGELYVGIVLEPQISVVSEKIVNVKLSGQIGAKLESKNNLIEEEEQDPDKLHLCKHCIEGELFAVISGKFSAELLSMEKLKFEKKFDVVKFKIFDFYWSFTYGDSGFRTCPHYEYLYTVHVLGDWLIPLEGAKVELDGESYTTDSAGDAKFYIEEGKVYTATVSADGYKSKTVDIQLLNLLDLLLGSFNKKTVCLMDWSKLLDNIGGIGSGGGSWGDDDYLLPDGSKRVKQVSLGERHSAAITTDGSLYTWGNSWEGQLGNGTTEHSSVPIKIMDNVASVSLGAFHSAAITTDGSLYMWGDNFYGQFGNGKSGGNEYEYNEKVDSNIPIKIMDNVASVSLGSRHSAAITRDGSLYMWGDNGRGGLGNGTTEDSYVPIKIMDNVAYVSLGHYHSAAITTDGSLYMWGYNHYGQLGNGTEENSLVPTKIMDNVASVNLGGDHSAAITTNGNLYMWGFNGHGNLGNGTTRSSYVPIKIMDNVASVSLGGDHSAAITTDGSLYMWGNNLLGQLGNGTTEDSNVPIKIMNNVTYANLGENHSSAITTDGSLYMWGYNYYKQLGNGTNGKGTTEYSNVPIKITIPADEPANSVALDFDHTAVPMDSAVGEPFTGLLPNEIYNVYGMRSRTVANPFSPDNLLYIYQGVTDASGNLYYDYQPVADCTEPVIFCKAMREFPVGNAQISGADVTSTSITVKWDAYPGADMYRVYKVVNGIYIDLGTTSGTSFTVTGLNPNWEYGFLVSSRVNGEWSYPSPDDIAYIATDLNAILGDLDGNGIVNVSDGVLMQRILAGLETDAVRIALADLNDSGEVNVSDGVVMQRILAGLE